MTHKLLRVWLLEPDGYCIKTTTLTKPMMASVPEMTVADKIDVGSYIVCEEEAMIVGTARNDHDHEVMRGFASDAKWHYTGATVWYTVPADKEKTNA